MYVCMYVMRNIFRSSINKWKWNLFCESFYFTIYSGWDWTPSWFYSEWKPEMECRCGVDWKNLRPLDCRHLSRKLCRPVDCCMPHWEQEDIIWLSTPAHAGAFVMTGVAALNFSIVKNGKSENLFCVDSLTSHRHEGDLKGKLSFLLF